MFEVDLGPGILAGYTTADDGNLALHVQDAAPEVARRRRALAEQVGAPVLFGRQVHGIRAVQVDHAVSLDEFDPAESDLLADDGGVDALVTTRDDLALGVLVADCVPVLLADPVTGVIAVAHAGRVGLLDGVLTSVVDLMRSVGAQPERLRVALGPCAGACCYEVPAEMAESAGARIPALITTTSKARPGLDLQAGCRAELERLGVREIWQSPVCTIDDSAVFSHRRGQPARFAGVIRLRA